MAWLLLLVSVIVNVLLGAVAVYWRRREELARERWEQSDERYAQGWARIN